MSLFAGWTDDQMQYAASAFAAANWEGLFHAGTDRAIARALCDEAEQRQMKLDGSDPATWLTDMDA